MKKKCRVLDYTGQCLPVLDASELQNENVECLYLFGTWENLRQALSVLSEKNAKREHLRVVAVICGQPCGDLSCVDRWFSLSSKTMPAASARAFMRNFERRLNNEQQP